MNFSSEITHFPSAVHKEIYFAARRLTPLAKSLSDISDPDMRLSCIDFYGFVLDILSDMYEYPEEHNLPVRMLEDFLDGKKVNGMKQKFPSKTKKLIALTIHPERVYMQFLCTLGKYGVLHNDVLIFSQDNLEMMKKRFKVKTDNMFLDNQFRALERVGLSFENNGFVSNSHPKMFSAMCALARKTDKFSGFHFHMSFCNAEFRNIYRTYYPEYKDYFNLLFINERKQANTLHDYAIQYKLSPTINTYWKTEYEYKNKKVMVIGTHDGILNVHIVGTNCNEDSVLINDRLIKMKSEFQKQVLRHLRRCDACATTHLGKFVTVLGKKQRVCGGGEIAFRWYNPTDDNLDIIKQLIQFRIEIIDIIK